MLGKQQTKWEPSKHNHFWTLLYLFFSPTYITPARKITIDEAIIAFHGHVFFQQYIRGKPQPWGIKACCKTGHLYNIIYYGRETHQITSPGLNHTTNVMLTLMDPLKNWGYDLYTDRFYTSLQLATELLHIGTTLTGTVMVDLPVAVKYTRPMPKRGDVTTFKKCSIVVMWWTDKRTLVTLSTSHSNSMVSLPSIGKNMGRVVGIKLLLPWISMHSVLKGAIHVRSLHITLFNSNFLKGFLYILTVIVIQPPI